MASIQGVRFGLVDPKVLETTGFLIESSETWNQNTPVQKGLNDRHLGTSDERWSCLTCGQKSFCPGHIGQFPLCKPCFIPNMLDHVIKTLRCICPDCSKLLLFPSQIREKSIDWISDATTNHAAYRFCGQGLKNDDGEPLGCGAHRANYTKIDGLHIRGTMYVPLDLDMAIEEDDKGKEEEGEPERVSTKRRKSVRAKKKRFEERSLIITAEKAHKILRKISEEDALLLGFGQGVSATVVGLSKESKDIVPQTLPTTTLIVKSTNGFPSSGQFTVRNTEGELQTISYTGLSTRAFTNCTGGRGIIAPGTQTGGRGDHPSWMIWTVLPVIPPPERPTMTVSPQRRGEDDLTYALFNIFKANQELAKKIAQGVHASQLSPSYELLQYRVATYTSNDLQKQPKVKQRSGRETQGTIQKLKGKEGLVRQNMMGKRVDQSARTVITGDPTLGIEELGVPLEIAMILTKPVPVTAENFDWCQERVIQGPWEYGGANSIIKTIHGRKYPVDLRLTRDRSEIILRKGMIIEVHLQDGDWLLFNRQPTLHRMGMMAHRVKVVSGSTFRLNESVTTPYNADFDGKRFFN